MLLSDEKLVKEMRMVLYDINQDLKTICGDASYTIIKGKFYCFINGILLKVKSVPIFDEKRLKKFPKLDKYFQCLNGRVKDSIELYKWVDKYKNNITGFEFFKSKFKIITDIPLVEYVSDRIDSGSEIEVYQKIIDSCKDVILKDIISYETFEEMKTSRLPRQLEFGDYKLILTFKCLLGFKKTSKCQIKIMEIDREENMFCAVIFIVNAKHKNILYFPFINF